MNDHDLLIQINTEVKQMKTGLSNHLKHHSAFALVLVSALIINGLALLMMVIRSK